MTTIETKFNYASTFQGTELVVPLSVARDCRDRLQAEVSRLRALVESLLKHEESVAIFHGLTGCNCINHSRKLEQAHEMGECPHQIARKHLNQPTHEPTKP